MTPMLEQYMEVKEQYPDAILFFRLGDFYEMFFDDAELASRLLELTLTGRGQNENRAPMCGVPYHSAEGYINRLTAQGYKVAICEQTEDPRYAKGIVKREVIRVVTPGTVTDTAVLEEGKNNYLAAVYQSKDGFGLVFCDVSTGEMLATEFGAGSGHQRVLDEMAHFVPSEIIGNKEAIGNDRLCRDISERFGLKAEAFDDRSFERYTAEAKVLSHFDRENLSGTPLYGHEQATAAVGAVLHYLELTQMVELGHMKEVRFYTDKQYMNLDASTRRSLEITETMREKGKKGSLLGVLDLTKTAMGARQLRKWLEQPLLKAEDINKRLDAVEALTQNSLLLMDLTDALKDIYDMERLLSKIIYGTVNGRDMLALRQSAAALPAVRALIKEQRTPLLARLFEEIDPLWDISALIERAINEKAPFSVREGDIIKDGYHEEVDRLRRAAKEGEAWVREMEEKERERTGIKTLRIRSNKVFGYYIEISKGQAENAPENYIRKQTLTNAERYFTPELKALEEQVLGASDKLVQLEYALFMEIREALLENLTRIQQTARSVGVLDALVSYANAAVKFHYVKPQVDLSDRIEIREGRHPVVERIRKDTPFVPNDTALNEGDQRLMILTGPNMAGKSTYMRQVALITLMAQAGSFVPAKSANIGIVDRIFTRVGASDDLASGQSTFMVEMMEVSNILCNATKKSLLILDEMGRGTSTFDGLSIAWAVVEHIADPKKLGAKTLFATHYHELVALEEQLEGVVNYNIAVKKRGDQITFLRKIVRGGADDSYGIEVAKLAGVPDRVVKRAKEILGTIEGEKEEVAYVPSNASHGLVMEEGTDILPIFQSAALGLLDEVSQMELSTFTPIEALNYLYTLQKKIKELR